MKILVNTRFLIKDKLEGIGRFTYETLKQMVLDHPEDQFYFLFDRKWDDEFIFAPNVIPIKKGFQARRPFLWKWWFNGTVPKVIKKVKPDVFLSTDGFTTLKTKVKKLTVIHDIAFEHYEGHVPENVYAYYKKYSPQYAKASDRIATVSQFSREDIAQKYDIDINSIDVVYNGSSAYFKPIGEDEKKSVRAEYTDGKPYMCYVGALQPRKNIINLLKAFDSFKKATKSDVKLVLVGRKSWNSKQFISTYAAMAHQDDVIFTDYLDHKEIVKIYGAALAMVYIPYFEGFGIPVIEAQSCDCPVITTDVSSLPEIAGNGAICVDPFDLVGISRAMIKVYEDADLRATLIQNGRENTKRFSWKKTADLLWQSIEKTVAG